MITSFLVSYSHMLDKVLFLGQIFETEIFMDLLVFKSPESENHIFSVWSVCVRVNYQNYTEVPFLTTE